MRRHVKAGTDIFNKDENINRGENNKILMRSWETGERGEVAKEMVSFLSEKFSENNFYFFSSTKRNTRI